MKSFFKKAFTLTELLVVVLVIGVLAGVAVPKLTRVLETRKTTEAEQMLAAVRTEQEKRCIMKGSYTTNSSDIIALKNASRSQNYTYKVDQSGVATAASKGTSGNKNYTLQTAYNDGQICCSGEGCDKLNKTYPTCPSASALAATLAASDECYSAAAGGFSFTDDDCALHPENCQNPCEQYGADSEQCLCSTYGEESAQCQCKKHGNNSYECCVAGGIDEHTCYCNFQGKGTSDCSEVVVQDLELTPIGQCEGKLKPDTSEVKTGNRCGLCNQGWEVTRNLVKCNRFTDEFEITETVTDCKYLTGTPSCEPGQKQQYGKNTCTHTIYSVTLDENNSIDLSSQPKTVTWPQMQVCNDSCHWETISCPNQNNTHSGGGTGNTHTDGGTANTSGNSSSEGGTSSGTGGEGGGGSFDNYGIDINDIEVQGCQQHSFSLIYSHTASGRDYCHLQLNCDGADSFLFEMPCGQ